jgi:hypothetical protein
MLNHSVASFRHFFGSTARFIVFADDPPLVEALRLVDFEIAPLSTASSGAVFDEKITWRKWAPRVRLDRSVIEFRVDSDIFLLKEPSEIRKFCEGKSGYELLSTQEEFTEEWPYGNFATKLIRPITPINAGFIGQGAGFDFTFEFENAYVWWKENVADTSNVKYHDEQGAVAFSIQDYIPRGKVMLLDPLRYRIVCPLNDPPVRSVDELVMMHCTYPDHPAFRQFLGPISSITRITAEVPN